MQGSQEITIRKKSTKKTETRDYEVTWNRGRYNEACAMDFLVTIDLENDKLVSINGANGEVKLSGLLLEGVAVLLRQLKADGFNI